MTSAGTAMASALARGLAALASAPSTRLEIGRTPRNATLQSAMMRPRWTPSMLSWSSLIVVVLDARNPNPATAKPPRPISRVGASEKATIPPTISESLLTS